MTKPTVKLIGTDGNVFSVIGLTARALKNAGQPERAKEFTSKTFRAGSYSNVLCLLNKYVVVK